MTARPQVLKVTDATATSHVAVGGKQLFERSLERERGRCYDIYSHTTRPFGAGYRSLSREALETSLEAGSDGPSAVRGQGVDVVLGASEGQGQLAEAEETNGKVAREEEGAVSDQVGTLVTTEVGVSSLQLDESACSEGQDTTNADADVIHLNIEEESAKEEQKITNTVEGYKGELDERDSSSQPSQQFRAVRKFEPTSFYEEEYSYEPESEVTTTKVVMRVRSLLNLDDKQDDSVEEEVALAHKNVGIGPRRATSELNLVQEVLKCSRLQLTQGSLQPASKKNRYQRSESLSEYLQSNRLKEFLVNNNVVIIEPSRSEDSVEGCRITSAMVKPGFRGIESNTLPRARVLPGQRRVFYHPIRVNRELIDTELPDPDKVRSARAMFQKVVTFRQPEEAPVYVKEQPRRTTPEVRVVVNRVLPQERTVDVILRHDRQRKRWTDTGSLSSGVGSDMSCDNELTMGDSADSHPDSFSSEDEEYSPEGHLVAPEVLSKIRACGTTVTYYGGKVISRSAGPLRSPMTMSIMDEIRGCDERSHGGTQYGGIKFRLVKSNSCGSRLELAGTEPFPHHHQPHRRENGDYIFGRLAECGEEQEQAEEEEEPQDTKEEDKLEEQVMPQELEAELPKDSVVSSTSLSWKALIDQRKQLNKEPMAMSRRPPVHDMEFEEFQVLEDVSVQHS